MLISIPLNSPALYCLLFPACLKTVSQNFTALRCKEFSKSTNCIIALEWSLANDPKASLERDIETSKEACRRPASRNCYTAKASVHVVVHSVAETVKKCLGKPPNLNRRCFSQKKGTLSRWTLKKKGLNFIFPTKYVIPKSLKFSHWLSEKKGTLDAMIS